MAVMSEEGGECEDEAFIGVLVFGLFAGCDDGVMTWGLFRLVVDGEHVA